MAEAFYDAFNAGDIETLTAILADDIVISDLPPFGTVDKLQWLAVHVASFGVNAQISFSNPSVKGNTLKAEHSYRSRDWVLRGNVEMVVEEGKITSFKVAPAEEILEELGAPRLPPELPPSVMPIVDMSADDNYQAEDGGLYGSGLNQPPLAHRSEALKGLTKIEPLDPQGGPSPGGKTVLISVGMSNTWQEFRRFQQLADSDSDKSSSLIIVNGAVDGMDARTWATTDDPWQFLEQRLRIYGVTPQQVQVAWVKQAIAFPSEPFPTEARKLQGHLATIMNLLKDRYPNLRAVYFSSRIYAGYARYRGNPEPFAYEGAFSVRWLIQDQIDGDPDLNYDPDKGPVTSPLLLWGPYLWTDGLNPRSDGLIWEPSDFLGDGTHPSSSGEEKVARMLLDFLQDEYLGPVVVPGVSLGV